MHACMVCNAHLWLHFITIPLLAFLGNPRFFLILHSCWIFSHFPLFPHPSFLSLLFLLPSLYSSHLPAFHWNILSNLPHLRYSARSFFSLPLSSSSRLPTSTLFFPISAFCFGSLGHHDLPRFLLSCLFPCFLLLVDGQASSSVLDLLLVVSCFHFSFLFPG